MSDQKAASRDLNKMLTPSRGVELDALYSEIIGTNAPAAGVTSERPLFLQAAEKRAQARGISAEQLLAEYAGRLSESNYPTPDCLVPTDVQTLTEGGEFSSAQKEHVTSCEACRRLLEAARPSSGRIEALMKEVRPQTPNASRELVLEQKESA